MNRQQRRAAEKSEKASPKQPANASTLLAAGFKYYQTKQLTEAEECCRKALALNPDLPDALHLLGAIAIEARQLDHAVELIIRAIRQKSNNPEYFLNLGLALQQLGRDNEALAIYDQAVILNPDYIEGWHELARLFEKLKRYDDALLSYDKVLSINPDYVDGLRDSGLLLMEKGRLDEALERFNRTVSLEPHQAGLVQNRGIVLQKLKQFDEALSDYNRALAINPGQAGALNNIGTLFRDQGQFSAALESFDRAIELRPDKEFLSNRADVLMELRRFDELWACCDRTLALHPDFAKIRYNASMYRLLAGDFQYGWIEREWRWKFAQLGLESRVYEKPLWLGEESISGKTILLYNDEGLGDALHFCRYIPMAAAQGARVILEIDSSLIPLLSNLDGVSICIERNSPLRPLFDFQCPLTSLPLAFRTQLETIPAAVPYLSVPAHAQDWAARLGSDARPKIGIVWSGNPNHTNDHNRSMSLQAWAPILDVDAAFISLQKQVRDEDKDFLGQTDILDIGHELATFSDTAALIASLDLVITVDTSVAHLAGALGCPVWILLPFTPDWRWLLDRDDSPWYPTARLFRQTETREWSSVIEQVKSALQLRVISRSKPTEG